MSTTDKKATKNWSLILGLSIPLLMTLFIAISIYAPRLFDNTPLPIVNFVYSSNVYYPHSLEVKNNKLEWTLNENQKNSQNQNDQPPRIYLHNVTTNKSSELTLTEAQELFLDNRNNAPDGYSIEQNRHHGFFLFDGHYSRNHYLVKEHAAHKLDLEYENNYYYNFRFLGWVIE